MAKTKDIKDRKGNTVAVDGNLKATHQAKGTKQKPSRQFPVREASGSVSDGIAVETNGRGSRR